MAGKPLRLLHVEDSTADAELLALHLKNAGYALERLRVETPGEMDRALKERVWDVVISDWSMPAFSAAEALRLLQKHDLDLPFVIISGTIGEDTAVAAMRAGAHDFLVKDNLKRLAPVLERELREAEMRRERRVMQEHLMVSDRMASVGLLAAGVAHEINNPLTALSGNLELSVRDLLALEGTLRSTLSPEALAQVERVLSSLKEPLMDAREAASRVGSIVRDLKVFSHEGDEDKTGPVELQRVIDSSLRMAWNELRHRARIEKNYRTVPKVKGSDARLGQVFLNLLVNAAQAIPEGHANEHVISVETGSAETGRVWAKVTDTGAGIAPELLPQLFKPFVTTKPQGVGTGLGLAICQRIVTSLGGTLTAQSEQGKGSTFTVTLESWTQPELPVPAHSPPRPKVRRAKVLVVDDEPIVSRVLKRMIADEHDVDEVTSAQDALRLFKAGRRYDVVFCDLMMPDMTGMELFDELSRTLPDQAKNMVFVTGGAFTERARAFLAKVENPRLEKPFDLRRLRDLVAEKVSS